MSSIQLNEPLLDEKLAQLEEARSWSSRVISKLETAIRTADDYALFRVNPLQYAKEKGMAEAEDDGEPFDEKMKRLAADLRAQTAEAERLDKAIGRNLKELRYDLT